MAVVIFTSVVIFTCAEARVNSDGGGACDGRVVERDDQVALLHPPLSSILLVEIAIHYD